MNLGISCFADLRGGAIKGLYNLFFLLKVGLR
jgi:hypothetical protein